MFVDRWDFNWQQAFVFERSIMLEPNDRISVTCEWDSSGKDVATKPGLGTQQEMCLFGIYAAEGEPPHLAFVGKFVTFEREWPLPVEVAIANLENRICVDAF